jgi:hypothetical protein
MVGQVLFIELNEINFDYIRKYCAEGKLQNFARLLAQHQVVETISENEYQSLEPWIQWVTAHTGKSLEEHGVFRLGDIHARPTQQIWEELESHGYRVGAISPMNATNRCNDPAFFMPDPWTGGDVRGPFLLKKLYAAVAQAVNDNAQARMTPGSAFWIAFGLLRYARPGNYTNYLRFIIGSLRGQTWNKPLILDQLLADVFIVLTQARQPDFASLFLNAGAHIQHHYMFNSSIYDGELKNPDWYVDHRHDPVFDVYVLYDSIVADIQARFPTVRLMLATGLHQDPHSSITFYWRLKDHAAFLRHIGVLFKSVEPRMSRDFLVTCADIGQAAAAAEILAQVTAKCGTSLFEVDNRGTELFIMLTWPHDVTDDFIFNINCVPQGKLRAHVVFVAIKNGQHNGTGYHIDTGRSDHIDSPTPLKNLPTLICEAFDLDWRE